MSWDRSRPDNGQHRVYGGGSGTDEFFTLEARTTVSPALVGPIDAFGASDFILTDKWQRVPIVWESCGVPVRSWKLPCHALARTHDLLNYEAAIAIAHLFIAQLVAPVYRSVHDVEVRLVKVRLKYSFEIKEVGVGEIINRSDAPWPGHSFKERETIPIPLSARDEVRELKEESK